MTTGRGSFHKRSARLGKGLKLRGTCMGGKSWPDARGRLGRKEVNKEKGPNFTGGAEKGKPPTPWGMEIGKKVLSSLSTRNSSKGNNETIWKVEALIPGDAARKKVQMRGGNQKKKTKKSPPRFSGGVEGKRELLREP